MKKYLVKTLILTFIFLALIQVPKLVLGPIWGNPVVDSKYKFILKNHNSYNSFIIGSSRVYRHFNCNLIDEKLDGMNSFNLGGPGTYIPEMYQIFNELKSNVDLNGKTIFIELQTMTPIAEVNKNTSRSTYCVDEFYYNFVSRYEASEPKKNRPKDSLDLSLYKETKRNNLINYKIFRSQVNSLVKSQDKITYNETKGFNARFKNVNSTPKEFTKKYPNLKKQYKFYDRQTFVNQFHLDYILEIIESANDKNVKVVFMLLPNRFHKLIALYKEIPDDNKVNFSNPLDYPELYYKENYFDHGHFNSKGADVFSKIFANRIANESFY